MLSEIVKFYIRQIQAMKITDGGPFNWLQPNFTRNYSQRCGYDHWYWLIIKKVN